MCTALKDLILMLDIKEAKCLEFTVQIYLRLKHIPPPPPIFISVYALVSESAESGLPIVSNGISPSCVCV